MLEDVRFQPPIAQVVFYQTGIGSAENFYSRYIQGMEPSYGSNSLLTPRDLTRHYRKLFGFVWCMDFFSFSMLSLLLGDKIEQAYAFIAQ